VAAPTSRARSHSAEGRAAAAATGDEHVLFLAAGRARKLSDQRAEGGPRSRFN